MGKNRLDRRDFVKAGSLGAVATASTARCSFSSKEAAAPISSRYEAKVQFPVKRSTEEYTLPSYQRKYICGFRGNTSVDVSPRPDRPVLEKMGSDDGGIFEVRKGYPIYLRDHLKVDQAPIKKVGRFVSSKLI